MTRHPSSFSRFESITFQSGRIDKHTEACRHTSTPQFKISKFERGSIFLKRCVYIAFFKEGTWCMYMHISHTSTTTKALTSRETEAYLTKEEVHLACISNGPDVAKRHIVQARGLEERHRLLPEQLALALRVLPSSTL